MKLLLSTLCLAACLSVSLSDCWYNGRKYREGSFNPTTCMNCQCYPGGAWQCRTKNCPTPNCADYTKRRGDCCYSCPNGETCRINGKLVRKNQAVTEKLDQYCTKVTTCNGGPYGGSISWNTKCHWKRDVDLSEDDNSDDFTRAVEEASASL